MNLLESITEQLVANEAGNVVLTNDKIAVINYRIEDLIVKVIVKNEHLSDFLNYKSVPINQLIIYRPKVRS